MDSGEEHESRACVCVCVSSGLLYIGFSACMFGLYSFMPVVLRRTSATAVNLSLLTTDLYSPFCGLFLFHYKVRPTNRYDSHSHAHTHTHTHTHICSLLCLEGLNSQCLPAILNTHA